jgi:hypothetical protein
VHVFAFCGFWHSIVSKDAYFLHCFLNLPHCCPVSRGSIRHITL